MSFNLIKEFTSRNLRVFSSQKAQEIGSELGISSNTMLSRLSRYEKKGIIERLMQGLYCLAPEFLSGIPVHEYEIALALVQPSAIAYLSAFSFHKLTDQIASIVYALCSYEEKQITSS